MESLKAFRLQKAQNFRVQKFKLESSRSSLKNKKRKAFEFEKFKI